MDSPILFSEKQRFKQWWLWLILLVINGIFILGIVQQVVFKQTFGDNPMSDTGLFIVAGSMLVFSIAFLFSTLETQITSEGIAVRFLPFHFKFKRYQWSDFSKIYPRKYSAIVDYGGWGIRFSLSGSGKAYNVSGKQGLQLQFNNGKRLLIGTQKSEELKAVLEKMGKLSE